MDEAQFEYAKKLIRAYTNIFHLTKEDCTITGLRLLGNSERNKSDVPVYRFQAIITAKSDFENIAPSNNDLIKLQKMKFLSEFGPEIDFELAWKINRPDGTTKRRSFDIRGQITPQNLIDWEIVDGIYYIKTELYGGRG